MEQGASTMLVVVDRLYPSNTPSQPPQLPGISSRKWSDCMGFHPLLSQIGTKSFWVFSGRSCSNYRAFISTEAQPTTPRWLDASDIVNKWLEGYLRCLNNGKPKPKTLQLQHNHSCFHSLLSLQDLYGKDPPQLLSFEKGTTAVSFLEEQLIERDATLDEITYHMTRWQEKRCVLWSGWYGVLKA